MKKSMIPAVEEAMSLSLAQPELTVRVMDRSYQRAVVCSDETVYRERVLCGWHTVATFKGGKLTKGTGGVNDAFAND